MSLTYRLLYAVGFTPWERMNQPPISDQIAGLLDREQAGAEPPHGRALDLGCGSGIWSVKLAARGWEVTGVDVVAKAIRRARDRAQEAGVEAQFIQSDIADLKAAGVGSGFRLLLDFGMFHDLPDAMREAEGRAASGAATPGATMLIMAWKPARRRFLPRGASRADIESAFPRWTVIDEDAIDMPDAAPSYVREAEPRVYRLRRH